MVIAFVLWQNPLKQEKATALFVNLLTETFVSFERMDKRKEKNARESSVSKKHKTEDPNDRRPIITQEKAKPKASNPTERGKAQNERRTMDKPQKRKAVGDGKGDGKIGEKDRISSKERQNISKAKRLQSVESRVGRETGVDEIYLRDMLEKKGIKKSGGEKSAKVKERLTRVGESGTRRKEEGRQTRVHRERTRTRTLSPTEIKQLVSARTAYEMAAGDGGAEVRGGPEVEKKAEETATAGSDEEYEDDFEEYASDFEDDSNSESPTISSTSKAPPTDLLETRTPPSPGIVEDQWKITVRKQELEAIKKSIEKENSGLLDTRQPERNRDRENESNRSTSGRLIDFSSASRRLKKTKKETASRERGEELLSMITLDTISYSILEIPAIPYEDFMRVFGKSNTKQVHVQTNEDDLDEEVQTDEIPLSNKWTQNPPEYLGTRGKTGSEAFYILSVEERLGVGGDLLAEEEITIRPNTNALWSFLSRASQLVLTALEKKSGNFLSLENMPNHSKAIAFGVGFVSLDVSDIPFLKGRAVTQMCSLSKTTGRLLSVHVNKEKSFQKCIICIWNLRELSKPLKVLMASNRVTSCCFGLNQGNLVFAGLSDGSICLWDLREPSTYHTRVTSCPEWSLQSATYTTAGIMRESGHCNPVVAVRVLSKVEASSGFGDFTPMQICSLDKDGTIIIWTVIQLEKCQRSAPSDDLGLAHWGRVKLIKSSSFSVFAGLRDEISGLYITCNDILINEAEDDGFYVANSLGSVHHCSAYGAPMKPKFYVPSKQDAIIETTCLELCPFDGNYFLVGCGDGTIRLHSRYQENPLICLNPNISGEEKEAGVVSLTWMRMRPCVFFALDSLSRINIWDLGVSDMYPEISLALTEKKITCMRLLPICDPRQVPFIVIGTEGGNIEIHKLKREYGCRTASEVQNEMKMFLKYVSIL